jgi:superfamily I DNA/RNA helicase
LLIADIIENEYKKEYFDVKDNEFKPVTPNDVVILSRSVETTYIQRLVSSLYRLGIPVNSKVSVNALEFPEVKTLVKFFELLENGRLDLPLITVMKSVIGDFSDEDLYDVASLYYNGANGKDRKNGGFFDAYVYAINHADGVLQEKLVRFDNCIKECRLLKDFIGAKGILDKVVSDTGYFNAILTLKEGRTISQVVEYFISKSVLGDKILTTFEFLEKIRLSDKAFRVETSVGEQAVRIMTIHASKGLEFPVVIAVGLEKKSNVSDEEKEILFSKENGFITKFYNTNTMLKEETPFRLLTKEQIRENRLKEELRLFYVALTRASYSLHMVAKCKGDPRTQTFTGGERYIDYVPESFPISIRTAEEFSFEAVKYEARKILVGKVNEERKEIIRKNIEFSYPHLLDVFVPLKTSVTSTLCLEDKTHLDDNDVLDNGKMCLPGKGVTDFDKLFRALNGVGFNGAMLIEAYTGDYGKESELFESLDFHSLIAHPQSYFERDPPH